MAIAFRILLFVMLALSILIIISSSLYRTRTELIGLALGLPAAIIGVVLIVMAFKLNASFLITGAMFTSTIAIVVSVIPTGRAFDRGKNIGGGVVATIALVVAIAVLFIK